jgi:hypothetical protein
MMVCWSFPERGSCYEGGFHFTFVGGQRTFVPHFMHFIPQNGIGNNLAKNDGSTFFKRPPHERHFVGFSGFFIIAGSELSS